MGDTVRALRRSGHLGGTRATDKPTLRKDRGGLTGGHRSVLTTSSSRHVAAFSTGTTTGRDMHRNLISPFIAMLTESCVPGSHRNGDHW